MNKTASLLSDNLAFQKEQLIISAINNMIGELWSVGDILDRIQFRTFPDRSEIIIFDNKELIHFYPIEIIIEKNDYDIEGIIKGTQRYKLLY